MIKPTINKVISVCVKNSQVKNCQFMYIEILVMIGGLDLVFRTLYFVNCKLIIFVINYSIIVMRWSSHDSFLMELARCTCAKWKGDTFSGKFNDSEICLSAIFGSIIEESSRQGCDLLIILLLIMLLFLVLLIGQNKSAWISLMFCWTTYLLFVLMLFIEIRRNGFHWLDDYMSGPYMMSSSKFTACNSWQLKSLTLLRIMNFSSCSTNWFNRLLVLILLQIKMWWSCKTIRIYLLCECLWYSYHITTSFIIIIIIYVRLPRTFHSVELKIEQNCFAGIQLGVSQTQLVGKFRKQNSWHS